MRPNDDESELLAAERALGLESAAQDGSAEAAAEGDPEMAMRVALWEIRFAEMAGLLPEQPPRAELRTRILGELADGATGRASVEPSGSRSWFGSVRLWQTATALCLALLAGTGGGWIQSIDDRQGMQQRLADALDALTEQQATAAVRDASQSELFGYLQGDQPGLWLVRFDGASGEFAVRALAGVEAPGGAYELWLLPAGNEAPRSIGLLSTQGSQSYQLPAELRMVDPGRGLAVSMEPDGGSPTGLPTGPVVYTGAVVEI